MNDVPSSLHVKLSGRGYSILLLKMKEGKHPVQFNLGSLFNNQMMIPDTAPDSWYLLLKSARYLLQRQMGTEVEIIDVLPDTIYFQFSEMIKKRVPVEPVLTFTLGQQHMLSGDIVVNPDTLLVYGPKQILDTLEVMHTNPLYAGELNDSLETLLTFPSLRWVSCEPQNVQLIIPVERFTEAVFEIPVQVTHVPEIYQIKIFPSVIKVICHVPLSRYAMVTPDLFRAEADYRMLAPGSDAKIKISLTKYPDFVELIDYSPRAADYLIEER